MTKRLYWQIYGFLLYRPWNAIRDRFGLGRLFTEIRAWCWNTGHRPLAECKVRHFVYNMIVVPFQHCPHCGYEDWTLHHDLFTCTGSGSAFDGEWVHHWFRGDQECFRCGVINEYADSSP